MSESEAVRRIEAARLVKRFPSLLGHVERGAIHLTALLLLRNHFTPDNVPHLVAADGQVVCGPHNKLYAEQAFGRAHIESRIHLRQSRLHDPSSPLDVAREPRPRRLSFSALRTSSRDERCSVRR
jgi:hypothetical protein